MFSNLVIGIREHFAGRRINDVGCQSTPQEEILRHHNTLQARLLHLAHQTHGNALVLSHNDLAALGRNIKARGFTTHALGHNVKFDAILCDMEGIEYEKFLEYLLRRVTQRLQQYGHRHFAAAIHAEVEVIFRVVLEVEPRTAVRDHPRRKQQLARRMRLAAVMFKKHAG